MQHVAKLWQEALTMIAGWRWVVGITVGLTAAAFAFNPPEDKAGPPPVTERAEPISTPSGQPKISQTSSSVGTTGWRLCHG